MSEFLSVQVVGGEVTPGVAQPFSVRLTNSGSDLLSVTLTVVGLDPTWVVTPPTVPVAAGATAETAVVITVPHGHPPSRLPGAVVARDDQGPAVSADLDLVVMDGSVLAATLEPPEVRGGGRGRAELVLRNRSRAPIGVDYSTSSPDRDLRVGLRRAPRLIEPGQEIRVRARLAATRPLIGASRRRPYVVQVRAKGTPVYVEGAFVQRALVAPWLTKMLAIVAVVALWAAVAIVGIQHLSKNVNKTANQRASNSAPLAPQSGPAGGSGTGAGGSGASGSGGSGSGGSGSGGSGSGGTGSGASGSTSSAAGVAASPAGSSRLTGRVAAAQPGGVTVTLQPAGLSGSSSTGGATTTSASSSGSGSDMTLASAEMPLYKLYGASLLSAPVRSASATVDQMTTTTTADGFWAFAGISKPGYYLVTFSKPGYATAEYVVSVPGGGRPVALQARMVPGDGALAGTVRGPSGPLGGVQLTITDGTVTLTTRTPTVGSTGAWAVHGLSTPDTYLVTATLPGYSTQTTLVTLGAGSDATGVNLTMAPGLGSVSGIVVSTRTGQPVGGLSVTVSNAAASRTTTTTTVASVGSYTVPDLPAPGTYALTISGPGYVSQTQQVILPGDPSKLNTTVNATVTPSSGDVTGVATASTGDGLAGAGAILANASNVYKTITTSSGTVGSFDFGQVPPGQYVLSVEAFGYQTASAPVTVQSGQVQTTNLILTSVGPRSLATASIQGSVESLITAKPVIGAQISIDGQTSTVVTDSTGSYAVHGITPGTHTVTASCPTATPCQSLDLLTNKLGNGDFETTTVQVTVPLGGLAFAPPVLMPKLDNLAGIAMDGTGHAVPNPVVTLTNPQTGLSIKATASPTASGADAAHGGFEFDNVPHGTYTLSVTGPPATGTGACTGVDQYKPYTSSITLELDTDYLLTGAPGTSNASPVLTVLPVYRVNTESIPPSGGSPSPVSGATVTVTGMSGTPSASFKATCTESQPETIVSLPESLVGDPFVANFSYTSGTVTYHAPQSAPFVAVYNSALTDTALLVPPSPDVTVGLSFPWRTPTGIVTCTASAAGTAPCPSLTAEQEPTSVSLSATFAGSGGTTATRSVQASPGTTPGSWSIPAASLANLVPGSVTFNVGGGAFQPYSFATSTTAPSFASQTFNLVPNLRSVVGTLASPVGGTTISTAPTESSLSITPGAGATDNLDWQVTGQPAGLAYPGVYNVTFAHSGYDTAVVSGLQIALCTTDCTTTPAQLGVSGSPTVTPGTLTYVPGSGAVTLTAHVTLQVTPSYTPLAGLPLPSVTVRDQSNALIGTVTLTSGNGTATFNDLSVTGNDYTVTVAGLGFATFTTTETLPSSSTTQTVTLAPSLTAEGYFTGLVDGLINTSPSPLAGATVTATLTTAGSGCTTASDPSHVSATTGANGQFVITNSSASDGGMCVGSTYQVSVTPPAGYSAPTVPASSLSVVVAQGDNQVYGGSAIDLQANQIPVTFTVVDGASSTTDLSGVTVTGASQIGRPVSGTTGRNGTVSFDVDPTTYTFTFSLPQYATFSETVTYSVGEASQSSTVPLALDHNTIEGTVTASGSCGATTVDTPCPLAGVTVTLVDSQGHTVVSGTTADGTGTAAKGTFSFTADSSGGAIRDGTYTLQASLAGFTYSATYQQSFTTDPSLVTIKNVSLVLSPVSLSITVSTNLTSASVTGDTVSLVPTTPPTGLSLTCQSSKSGGSNTTLLAWGEGSTQTATIAAHGNQDVATVPSLVPDYYDLVVTGTGVPSQTADGLVVCPSGNVAEYSPAPATAAAAGIAANAATFEVLMGQITGYVAVSSNSAITADALTVTITPSTGTADVVTANCVSPPSGCSKGTFTSDFLPLGLTYTVQASAQGTNGYSPSSSVTVSLSSTIPPTTATAASTSSSPLTVSPTPIDVKVTVTDATNTTETVAGLTVTLSNSALTAPLTAVTATGGTTNGVADFPLVNPESSAYTVTVSSTAGALTITSGSSFQVSIGATSPQAQPVSVDYTGSVSGSVTASSGATVTVNLCSTATSPCTGTSHTSSVTGTGSYSFTGVDPGTWYISDSIGDAQTSLTVSSNATTTGPSYVYTGSISGSVDATASVTVTVCDSNSCSGVQHTQTVASGGTYTFSGLAPGTWYVYSTTDSTKTQVTVTSGQLATGPNYVYDGGITGSVTGPANSSVRVTECLATTCTNQTVQVGSSKSASYSFTNLPPGSYTVSADQVTGATKVTPASQTVTVTSGTPVSLSDFVLS